MGKIASHADVLFAGVVCMEGYREEEEEGYREEESYAKEDWSDCERIHGWFGSLDFLLLFVQTPKLSLLKSFCILSRNY